jgi:hypothetical protein
VHGQPTNVMSVPRTDWKRGAGKRTA